MREFVQADGRGLPVRVHAHGGGVHQHLAVVPELRGGERQLLLSPYGADGIAYAGGSHAAGGRFNGAGGSSGPEYHHFGAFEIDAGVACEGDESVVVSVVTGQLAVLPYNGVDGVAGAGGLGDGVQVRHHGALVGNGDVDAAEVPVCQELWQLFRRQLPQFIRGAAEHPVDFPREAVSEVFAYESEFHYLR